MLPGSGELIPNHTQAQQPGAEGVSRVCGLSLGVAGGPLVQRLGADGKAQLDVRLDLSSVLHRGVEQPELHRAVREHAVEV